MEATNTKDEILFQDLCRTEHQLASEVDSFLSEEDRDAISQTFRANPVADKSRRYILFSDRKIVWYDVSFKDRVRAVSFTILPIAKIKAVDFHLAYGPWAEVDSEHIIKISFEKGEPILRLTSLEDIRPLLDLLLKAVPEDITITGHYKAFRS